MLHCSWDMVRDGYDYFSFWPIFFPFTTLTVWKIKIFQKIAPGDIILQKCTKNHVHMLCCPDIWRVRGVIIFLFWASFCPFTPLTAWKIIILKNQKNAWRYHFTHVQNYDLMVSSSCDMVCILRHTRLQIPKTLETSKKSMPHLI